jgi:ubiquinone biosynthesis protein COQ4
MQPAVSPADPSTLSPLARWHRGLRALADLIADPEDTTLVFTLAEMVNAGPAGHALVDRFHRDPVGRRLYAERRAIDSHGVDYAALAALPDGTLGREYLRFLRDRDLSPDVFAAPDHVADPRAAYVHQRMRQTHDLWHVVTGYATDPSSEVALQAFTYGQLRVPSALLIAIAGTLRGVRHQHALPREVMRAYRDGAKAAAFATFPWEDHWATPLVELRRTLGVTAIAAA